jgi:hypothetical protein
VGLISARLLKEPRGGVIRGADEQREVHGRCRARFHRSLLNDAPEPLNFRAYLIFAGQERGETVGALLGGGHGARQASRQANQLYLRPGDGGSRRVEDHAGNDAGRRLRADRVGGYQRQ